MKKIMLALFMFSTKIYFSQINLENVQHFESKDGSYVNIIDSYVDNQGNYYSTGVFKGTIDFDSNPTSELVLTSSTVNTIFVTKSDANGKLIWAKNILADELMGIEITDPFLTRVNLNEKIEGRLSNSIVVDKNQNVYIGGRFNAYSAVNSFGNPIEFSHNGPNLIILNSSGDLVKNVDLFPELSNSNETGGNYLTEGGNCKITYEYSEVTSMTLNSNNELLITGMLNVGSSIFTSELFIIKANLGGGIIFKKTIQNKAPGSSLRGRIASTAIEVNSKNEILIGGNFEDSVDFDPSPNSYIQKSINSEIAGFVLKLDNSGNYIWSKILETNNMSNQIVPTALKIDNNNNILLTGWFQGEVDFDSGIGTYVLKADTRYNSDGFILKLDDNGGFVFAKNLIGADIYSVEVDANNSYWFYGVSTKETDFDFSSKSFYLNQTNFQGYILNTSNNFDFKYCKRVAGINNPTLQFVGYKGVFFSPILAYNNNIYIQHTFKETTDFDVSKGEWIIDMNAKNSTGYAAIQKFSIDNYCLQNYSVSNLNESVCGLEYTAPDNLVYNTSGKYAAVLTSMNGCDSVIFIDLKINSIPTASIIQSSNQLLANPDNLNYQWINCDTKTEINNEVNQVFNGISGNYAVKVTDSNGCSDTSTCVTFLNTANVNTLEDNYFKIYPNPTSTNLYLNSKQSQIKFISITDINGKVCYSEAIGSTSNEVNVSNLNLGVYLIEISTDSKISIFKFIKN